MPTHPIICFRAFVPTPVYISDYAAQNFKFIVCCYFKPDIKMELADDLSGKYVEDASWR